MAQTHFYAQEDDIIPVLKDLDEAMHLVYIRMDHYTDENYDRYKDYREIPGVGIANGDAAVQCSQYLAIEPATKLIPSKIIRTKQTSIDQLLNPDSIVVSFGGLWNGEVVISGRVATVSDSVGAQGMLRRFQRSIKKHFIKIRAFYVGPKAMASLKSGRRLTAAIQCPPEYDLAL